MSNELKAKAKKYKGSFIRALSTCPKSLVSLRRRKVSWWIGLKELEAQHVEMSEELNLDHFGETFKWSDFVMTEQFKPIKEFMSESILKGVLDKIKYV